MSVTRIDELLEKFDWFDGVYKRAEMDEALTLREEITPRLLAILEAVAADPGLYDAQDHYAAVYAVALLAHFQEPTAHLPIIRAFSIPQEPLDNLWGDMVTETLPALLIQTCNGDLSAIKKLVLDRQAPEFTRTAAVVALTYAVTKGMTERDVVLAFLSSLFTGSEAEADSYFWGSVVCALCDLHPAEVMEVIQQAFADGLIDPFSVTLEDVNRDLEQGREATLARLMGQVERSIPRDVHDYLSWFACFRERSAHFAGRGHGDTSLKALENRKKKSRTKNKQAKKARKKNRR